MGVFSWIILGLIAGAVGKLLMPGKDPGGLIITILLGIGGAFVGGFIGTRLGWGDIRGPLELRSLGLAVGGSVLILFLYRLVGSKKK